jgi:hypothetical protein
VNQLNMTMATTSIRQEIAGVIAHIDNYSGHLKILAANGNWYSVHQNRIVNSFGGHRYVAQEGDEITFVLSADDQDRIVEVRFVDPPEVELADEATSVVDVITDSGLIFGKRVQPDCGCPLLLGTTHKNPNLDVGTQVRHTLGTYNSKCIAENLRVNWTLYGEGGTK